MTTRHAHISPNVVNKALTKLTNAKGFVGKPQTAPSIVRLQQKAGRLIYQSYVNVSSLLGRAACVFIESHDWKHMPQSFHSGIPTDAHGESK
ncbi:MAG: hypothetical protein WBA88_11560 [Pseudaminobacter sp.]